MTEWNVLDSSAWLAFFTDGPNAEAFSAAATDVDRLIVPTVAMYEVFKHVARERSRAEAVTVVGQMRQGRIIDLDAALALEAAEVSSSLRLAMADSMILATARRFDATLWTQDTDFDGIDGVRYLPA